VAFAGAASEDASGTMDLHALLLWVTCIPSFLGKIDRPALFTAPGDADQDGAVPRLPAISSITWEACSPSIASFSVTPSRGRALRRA
jgi:hypothetical protein